MKRLFLILAIVGAILPYFFFTQFIIENGVDLPDFVSALFTNPPASGFTSDLLFTSFVFWIMMYSDKKKDEGPSPTILIVLNLAIGLSCAFPAYIYVIKELDFSRIITLGQILNREHSAYHSVSPFQLQRNPYAKKGIF